MIAQIVYLVWMKRWFGEQRLFPELVNNTLQCTQWEFAITISYLIIAYTYNSYQLADYAHVIVVS